MNKHFLSTTGLLMTVIILFTASCNKDSEKEQCRIFKVDREIHMVCPDGVKSQVYEVTFNYDSNDRIVRLDFDNGSNNEFFYNSNGRIVMIDEDYLVDKNRLIFTWEGNQVTRQHFQLEEGVYKPSNLKRVYYFNDQQQLLSIEHYSLAGGSWKMTHYDLYTWEGQNFSKVEQYWEFAKSGKIESTHEYSNAFAVSGDSLFQNDFAERFGSKSNAAEFIRLATTTITWDNKPSPFGQNLGIAMQNTDMLFLFAKNNPLVATTTNHLSGEVEVESASYTFADNGYPSHMEFIRNFGGCTHTEAWDLVMRCF